MMKKLLLLSCMMGLVITTGCLSTTDETTEKKTHSGAVTENTIKKETVDTTAVNKEDKNEKKEDVEMDEKINEDNQETTSLETGKNQEINTGTKKETAKTSSNYLIYSADAVTKALASGDDVVLFFHAGRCPSCKALDKNINKELANIPTNLKIFKVDYDNAKELKVKYKVTTQHTLIVLNTDESTKTKKVGANDLKDIVALLK